MTTVHNAPPEILPLPNGQRLAYRATPGRLPRIVFVSGFTSDMTGQKATHLAQWAVERGHAYLRFDYSGHGLSDGAFTDGTIGRWTEDTLALIDHVAPDPVILAGSSMGGWIMVLAALARPSRVAGLVGVAAAPDFTEDLVWGRLDEAQRAALLKTGSHHDPSRYSEAPTVYTRRLIEEARQHLVLRAPIPLTMKVRLLHGTADPDVTWRQSQRLLECLESPDVALTLIKDGDHRLSEPGHLAQLERAVAELSDA